MRTQADADTFMVRQEAALQVCEFKRSGLEALVDASQPDRPWWKFWN